MRKKTEPGDLRALTLVHNGERVHLLLGRWYIDDITNHSPSHVPAFIVCAENGNSISQTITVLLVTSDRVQYAYIGE